MRFAYLIPEDLDPEVMRAVGILANPGSYSTEEYNPTKDSTTAVAIPTRALSATGYY